MTGKKLAVMGGAAILLGACALLLDRGSSMKAPDLVGKKLIPALDWSSVSRIEMGGGSNRVAIASSDNGWTVESLFGYPASEAKIRRNLLALQECSVGDVSSREIKDAKLVDIQNASGKSMLALILGDKRQPSANPEFPYAPARADGRYVRVGNREETLLVGDSLEAFDGAVSDWADTEIASVDSASLTSLMFISADGKDFKLVKKDGAWTMPGLGKDDKFDDAAVYSSESAFGRLEFASVADPKIPVATSGLDKPACFIAQATDGSIYTAQIGAATPAGDERYLKIRASFSPTGTNATANAAALLRVNDFNARNEKWVYLVSASALDPMMKQRADFIKKEEKENKGGQEAPGVK